MSNFRFHVVIFCMAFLFGDSLAQALPPGGRPGGGQGQGRGPGGAGGQQTPPLMRIFDTDGDGSISKSEIDNASAALRKLDLNGDGVVTAAEMRPTGGPGGGGKRGGDPAQADAAFAAQVKTLDKNNDGLISRDELPAHMHAAFAIADADKNGSLNDAELLVLASKFRRNQLNPDGEQEVRNLGAMDRRHAR